MITLKNVNENLKAGGVIIRERMYEPLPWKEYRLVQSVYIQLSNGTEIFIPKGFEWDLSSSPRILWWLFPPDGPFEIGALIHDYLYQTRIISDRAFIDKEMYLWSQTVNPKGVVDNKLRYLAVRLFGGILWKEKKKMVNKSRVL